MTVGLSFASASQASTVHLTNIDRNYFVRAIDWIETTSGTSVLILTYPDTNQPHIRERCTANFYVIKAAPGLKSTELLTVAENYCGHRLGASGRLLTNGDVVLLVEGRVETWRPDVGKIDGFAIADVDALERHHPSATSSFRNIDVFDGGSVAYAGGLPRARGDADTPSAVIAGLSRDGEVRWDQVFAEAGVALNVDSIWATADGGALLLVTASPMRGRGYAAGTAPADMAGSETRLYRFSATGDVAEAVVINREKVYTEPADLPDPETDPEAYHAALNRAIEATAFDDAIGGETIGHARADGSVDMLLGAGTRRVRVISVDASGRLARDEELVFPGKERDRPRWRNGIVTEQAITLFGSVGLKETRLPQGYVSQYDSSSRQWTTRLAPLEGPGLEAAINARDSEQRFLEHNPSQTPQLLAALAGEPLMVSMIMRNRMQGLQLTAVDDALPLYAAAGSKARLARSRPASVATVKEDAPAKARPTLTEEPCTCTCEHLTKIQQQGEALEDWAKANDQPAPFEEFGRISMCLMSCQQQAMACIRQR
ncbi:MAG: hypothetical protein AAF417_09150 [Pseudomonadota bacterium]